MDLSELIVRRIVAVNRVNLAVSTYSIKNRPYCTLTFKLKGRTVYNQDGQDFLSDSTHVIFVPAGASYSFRCEESGECIMVEFSADNTGTALGSFAVHNEAEIESILTKLERSFTFKKPGFEAYCLSGLYRLLYYIISQNESQYLAGLKKKRIEPGLNYLESNYQELAMDTRKLAELCGISEVYFRKLFTEVYGTSPKKYLGLIRMAKAKELLLTKEITVQQVAEKVGFRDVYSFCKSFRKTHDCTPTEYRKAHWK
jgi:AraC-like DNA-binding protein